MTSTGDNTKKSVVDRSVVPILSNPDDTPSRRDGISPQVEREHRIYGTCLIQDAAKLLKLNHASTYATACTLFHRFYHRVSLQQHCVWSVAMASLLLATKIEEQPRTVRHIVLIFDHLYRKRRGCLTGDATKDVLPLNKLGPAWKEWYEKILELENLILRELGFTLYWIPDSHPHKFLWEFLRVLLGFEKYNPEESPSKDGEDQQKEENDHHHALAQRAWNYCNDSCRLDLCVRFDSEVITCAAIHLAARDLQLTLPPTWWKLFVDDDNSKVADLSNAANAILGLLEYERNNPSHRRAFLPSLVKGGSFNDQDSFLWESRA